MRILDRIRANGGSARMNGHKLALKRGRLDESALHWIKKNRERLIQELWPEYDDFEERAAIMEYDGGLIREDAERLAYEGVKKC